MKLWVAVLTDRLVKIGRAEILDGELKRSGDHANDRAGLTCHGDRPADDIWVGAEFSPPQAFRDHCGRVRAPTVFVRTEVTPEYRCDLEDGEEGRRNALRAYIFRFADAGDRAVAPAIQRHHLEGPVLALPVEEIGVGDRALRKVLLVLEHHHDSIRVSERQP